MDRETGRRILREKYLEGFAQLRTTLHDVITQAPDYLPHLDEFVQTFMPLLSKKDKELDPKKVDDSIEIRHNSPAILDVINKVIDDLNLGALTDTLTDIGLGLALAQGTQWRITSFATEIPIQELQERYGALMKASGYEKLDPKRKKVVELAAQGTTDFQIALMVDIGDTSRERYLDTYMGLYGLASSKNQVSAYYTYLRLTAEFLMEE